ncbi:MAG: aspartyl protease family protein [Cyclobacteriaceae bacterium]
MDLSKVNCLTIAYNNLSNQILCSVKVSTPQSLLSQGENQLENVCLAIWDTGATGSAITALTAKKLNLAPVSIKRVSGLGGTVAKNVYLVDIHLPNNVKIPNLSVTEIDNPQDEKGNIIDNFGVLIGMDIICRGDFSLTNFEGKTIMSFRMPSSHKVDYVEEWNRRMAVQQKYRRK